MKSENEIVQSIAAQECAAAQHRSVTYFEDAPCYPIEKLVKLHGMRREMLEEQDEAKQRRLAAEYHAFMDTLESCRMRLPAFICGGGKYAGHGGIYGEPGPAL